MELSRERMIALAQGQLDAYNARNVDGFCKCYHPDVKAYRLPTMELICEGAESFRELYQGLFAESPELHCELRNRIVLGGAVLDEEWVTGRAGSSTPSHVVATYFFKDDLIHRIFFSR